MLTLLTITSSSLPIDEDNQPPPDPQQAYFDLATDYNVASAMNNIEVYYRWLEPPEVV
jgi:hypothetical protein